MIVGAKGADGTGRNACDRRGLAVPHVLAARARSYVDRVFQRGWHRSIVLGCNEQDRVRRLDQSAKRQPGLGRAGPFEVRIVKRQLDDFRYPQLSDGGAREIREFASFRLKAALRRLPIMTMTCGMRVVLCP